MEVDHIVDFIYAELQFSPSSITISHHLTNKRGRGMQKSKLDNIHSSYEPKTDGIPLIDSCVDTVLINAPFGTKHNAGIDVGFWQLDVDWLGLVYIHFTNHRPELICKRKLLNGIWALRWLLR